MSSWNLGTLTSWNPLGHPRPVTGLLYLYLHSYCGLVWCSKPFGGSYYFHDQRKQFSPEYGGRISGTHLTDTQCRKPEVNDTQSASTWKLQNLHKGVQEVPVYLLLWKSWFDLSIWQPFKHFFQIHQLPLVWYRMFLGTVAINCVLKMDTYSQIYRVYLKCLNTLKEWVIHIKTKKTFHTNMCPKRVVIEFN